MIWELVTVPVQVNCASPPGRWIVNPPCVTFPWETEPVKFALMLGVVLTTTPLCTSGYLIKTIEPLTVPAEVLTFALTVEVNCEPFTVATGPMNVPLN